MMLTLMMHRTNRLTFLADGHLRFELLELIGMTRLDLGPHAFTGPLEGAVELLRKYHV